MSWVGGVPEGTLDGLLKHWLDDSHALGFVAMSAFKHMYGMRKLACCSVLHYLNYNLILLHQGYIGDMPCRSALASHSLNATVARRRLENKKP